MVERAYRLVAWSLALALVASLMVSAPVVAQPADEVTTTAGINADRLDGKHAVAATNKAGRRANKLVATNREGLLPSNILKPLWSLMVGIPAVLADGQVSWAEIVGLPAILADGQVSWGEVAGIPAGFADGVDDGAFVSSVVASFGGGAPWGVGGTFTFGTLGMDRNVDLDCYIIPTVGPAFWTGPTQRTDVSGASVVRQFTWQTPNGGYGEGKVRCRAYSQGIAPAALKQQLKNGKVTIKKGKTPR